MNGESCVELTCVPDDNVSCTSFVYGGRDQRCLVTGVSSVGRGTPNTRSSCE